jgi:hypothetical protein
MLAASVAAALRAQTEGIGEVAMELAAGCRRAGRGSHRRVRRFHRALDL